MTEIEKKGKEITDYLKSLSRGMLIALFLYRNELHKNHSDSLKNAATQAGVNEEELKNTVKKIEVLVGSKFEDMYKP